MSNSLEGLDLHVEQLESMEAPMTKEEAFAIGFVVGVAVGIIIGAT